MAPATEYQGSFLSRISIRRNQIVSMDVNREQELEELEIFQKHVAERFAELLSPLPPSSAAVDGEANSQPSDPILSISWLRKLLNVFLSCEAEFKAVLMIGRGCDPTLISKPPVDRLVPEMLDRYVKALDICTAVVNGVDSVRHCQRLAEIAVTALKQRPLSDGSVRRAKRALANLFAALNLDERDHTTGSGSVSGGGRKTTERSWSFGRRGGGTSGGGGGGSSSGGGSHRWSVGKNWSAAKQIQAMAANLAAPRGAEASGLASPIYITSTIMVLVMWVLAAAVPCQAGNGLAAANLPLPRHQSWASTAVSIHERIGEELKRKEKRGGGGGLMEEMQRMERVGIELMDFAEGFRFPAEAEQEEVVAGNVAEMEEVCRKMEEGLLGLQKEVREVFHRVVRSRTEILEALDQAGKISAPAL